MLLLHQTYHYTWSLYNVRWKIVIYSRDYPQYVHRIRVFGTVILLLECRSMFSYGWSKVGLYIKFKVANLEFIFIVRKGANETILSDPQYR